MTKEQLRSYRSIKSHINMLKAQRDDLILRSSSKTGEAVKHSGISKPVENITEKREKIEERIAEQEAELAEKLDLSKQAIWAWENKRREIGMCSLVRIALALEVSTDWLLGISDKKEITL